MKIDSPVAALKMLKMIWGAKPAQCRSCSNSGQISDTSTKSAQAGTQLGLHDDQWRPVCHPFHGVLLCAGLDNGVNINVVTQYFRYTCYINGSIAIPPQHHTLYIYSNQSHQSINPTLALSPLQEVAQSTNGYRICYIV